MRKRETNVENLRNALARATKFLKKGSIVQWCGQLIGHFQKDIPTV